MNFLDERLPPRFWKQVQPCPMSGCWLWTASPRPDGYGRTKVAGRAVYAHRLTYAMLVAPVPDGLDLDHKCRVRCCVNPAHLEPVTHAENVRRGLVGAYNAAKSACPQGHPYDERNTRVHNGRRVCRTCTNRRSSAIRSQKRKAARQCQQ